VRQRRGRRRITARRPAVMSGQLIFGLGIGFAPEWALCCTSLLPCTGAVVVRPSGCSSRWVSTHQALPHSCDGGSLVSV
jgi:hypothetical protein